MRSEVLIYSERAERIPIDEILAGMQARGIPVEWRYILLSEKDRPSAWTAGDILPRGGSGYLIGLSNDPVEDHLRKEILSAFGASLTEPQRQTVERAQVRYRLTLDEDGEGAERAFANLAMVILDLGGGIVRDYGTRQFYSRDEFLARHAGGPSR